MSSTDTIEPREETELPEAVPDLRPRSVQREEPEKAAEPESKPEPEKLPRSDYEWQDTRSIEGQYVSHPETCRMLATRMEMFKMPEQQTALNDLLAGTFPHDSPSLMTERIESNPVPGGFCVMVTYHRIQYRKIAPSTKS
jgi:hypothetical protein